MSRTIFCSYLKCNSEGQDFQIYPGELGRRIYNQISKSAWQKWLVKQTIIINERQLNMTNPKHRELLQKEMEIFLFNSKDYSI